MYRPSTEPLFGYFYYCVELSFEEVYCYDFLFKMLKLKLKLPLVISLSYRDAFQVIELAFKIVACSIPYGFPAKIRVKQ